jgi:dihydrofolate reductase
MNMPFDLLLGRKTFEIWALYWPQHADAWPGVNAATKYVASNTIQQVEYCKTKSQLTKRAPDWRDSAAFSGI